MEGSRTQGLLVAVVGEICGKPSQGSVVDLWDTGCLHICDIAWRDSALRNTVLAIMERSRRCIRPSDLLFSVFSVAVCYSLRCLFEIHSRHAGAFLHTLCLGIDHHLPFPRADL